MTQKRILLIIGGGIAAYKSLDLIRRLRERGIEVRCILTKGGAEFVTPLSVAALSEQPVFTDLFDLKDETEMGHIRLSREADLVLVAPATADLLAKMAHGHADDLASTALLATDKPVMVAPSMNTRMWDHKATQRNFAQVKADGVLSVGPGNGELACGEVGAGRMAEVADIVNAVEAFFDATPKPLKGRKIVLTAGPTWEAIDPVRYIANRSSGKQGYALAGALAHLGADVVLVSGPTALPTPPGVARVDIESARDMLKACEGALPADALICVAAVADWRSDDAAHVKIKKNGGEPPALRLAENPDILATLSKSDKRPPLVIGFAAETNDVVAYAQAKRARKGCDWIVANDVSGDVMGGDNNSVHIITDTGVEDWPHMSKADVGARLAQRIADHFKG